MQNYIQDTEINAIAKVLNMDSNGVRWGRVASAERVRICTNLNEQYYGARVDVYGVVKGFVMSEIFLLITTGCPFSFMCSIQFPSSSHVDNEFPTESSVTIKAKVREIELSHDYSIILHCDSVE
jgi:hypothetical protein